MQQHWRAAVVLDQLERVERRKQIRSVPTALHVLNSRVPILNSFPPPPSKKPGNVFFAVIILVGVAVLVGIWLSEKHPSSQPKIEPATRPLTPEKTIVKSAEVLSVRKTTLPGKPTNVIPLVATKVQSVPPPFSPSTNVPPVGRPSPQFAQTVFEAQVALARRGISAGSIDGVIGSQSRAAVRAFQRSENLPVTGELDAATKAKLVLTPPLYTELIVTTNDVARLQPLGTNWLSKSQQSRLDYETILELVAEKSRCHPAFLKRLNPGINWANVPAGTSVRVPNLEIEKPKATAAWIRIRLAEKTLEAFDENTNLLAHFPCSIARRVEQRPVGELFVEKLAPNPDYTFAPENFPESSEAREIKTKLILPPGPNNPVGTVWIGLDKPGYGIHGTPKPEEVGRTESHGCFRLANWNAEYLLRLVTIGTPVLVEP